MKNIEPIDIKILDNKAFQFLHKNYFKMVNNFIVNNSGREEDAEDIFQDTMIILLQKLRKDDFLVSASLKTYIYAISKNLWLKKLRFLKTHKQTEFFDSFSDSFYAEVDDAIENEKNYLEKLYNGLKRISNHCLVLIQDIFFQEKTIDQIKNDYGYTTKHNAQNQKYKCVKQLKEAMKSDL